MFSFLQVLSLHCRSCKHDKHRLIACISLTWAIMLASQLQSWAASVPDHLVAQDIRTL